MFTESIKEHLAHAFRTISAQGQQRQQMLGQVAPSSNHVTMIPTPGMSQCANGNSVMPYVMDTTTTTDNSSAGMNNFCWLMFIEISYAHSFSHM